MITFRQDGKQFFFHLSSRALTPVLLRNCDQGAQGARYQTEITKEMTLSSTYASQKGNVITGEMALAFG